MFSFSVSLLSWLLLCCLLGVLSSKGFLAPLTDENAQEHFLRGLPIAVFLSFVSAAGAVWGVGSQMKKEAAEAAREESFEKRRMALPNRRND